MQKSKLIIIEGPQGTGKTTLANHLRENLAGSNLYRLSGQKDKTETGKNMSIKMYEALMEYLEKMQGVPMDMIFDRTFFTEEVYARLKYKDYTFTEIYNDLVERLNNLDYEIYYISLYLENVELFKERLIRVHHNYQVFSVDGSVKQQNIYKDLREELKQYSNINIIPLAMDNFDEAYKKINNIFEIE